MPRTPIAAAAAASASLLAFAAPAGAVDARYATLLTRSCPVEYQVVQTRERWSEGEVSDALDGVFDISETPTGKAILRPPIDWRQDPFRSESWRGDLHSLKWLDVLFYAYRTAPEEEALRALELAREIVLDWIAATPPPPAPQLDNKPWGPKVSGDRAPYIAYLLRALACEQREHPDILGEDRAVRMLNVLAEHLKVLADPANARQNNQGLFMDIGLVLLANYLGEAELPGVGAGAELGRSRFPQTLLARTAVDEGVFLEHSTGYQRLATNVLRNFLRFTGNQSHPTLAPLLDRMVDAAGWFVMPDGTFPQFGDTYLRPAPDYAREAARDDSGLRVFRRAGYVVVKDPRRGSFFAVTAGFHNRTHKHADDTSFELYEHGRRIISDTGLFHKDDGNYRAFEQNAQAHSVLTEGREDFDLRPSRVYGSGIEATGSDAGWFAIQAVNPLLASDGIRLRRTFLYRPGEVLVVIDEARSRQREQFRRWFHLGPDIRTTRAGSALRLAAPGFSGLLSDTDKGTRKTYTGSERPFQGYTFPSFRVTVERTTVMLQSRPGDKLAAAAVFSLGGTPYRAAAVDGGRKLGVELRRGKRRERLEVRRKGARVAVKAAAKGG